LWNAQTGDKLASWLIASDKNAYNVHHVAISPWGNRIVSASYGRRPAQVWTWSGVAQASPARPVALQDDQGVTHDAGITSVAFDPTGSLIVTTSWDRTARIWDADIGRLLWELPAYSDSNPQAHRDHVLFARFSPDSRRVVTASGDGKARVWQIPVSCAERKCGWMPGSAAGDTRTSVSLAVSLEGHSSRVTSAAFDVSGKQVITASSDGTVRLWSASGGELMRLLQGPAEVSGFGNVAALRQDGRQIAPLAIAEGGRAARPAGLRRLGHLGRRQW
jgi:WD40 repeat protein